MDRIFKEKICVICENIYIPTSSRQKFCSQKCYKVSRNEKNKIICKEKNKDKEYLPISCKICGKQFIPKSANEKICSDECRKNSKKITCKTYRIKINALKIPQPKKPNTPKTIHLKICVECGKEFNTIFIQTICCSDECKKEYKKKRTHEYNIKNKEYNSAQSKEWYKKNKVYVYRICEICGNTIPKVRGLQNTCSKECAYEYKLLYNKIYYKTDDGKDTSRRAAGKRRALKRNAISEKIDYDMINERDGFKCQLCFKKVDMQLKHPDPMCKSYDHIVPLSKGGEDTNRNIQLTHLKCNLQKHNIIDNGVQMYLF